MTLHTDHTPRVARKRQARQREIVRRGLAIAAAEGVEALTIARLAAELDYTPGALYRYFASKDALVAEVQRSVVAYLAAATAEAVNGSDAALAAEGIDGGRRQLARAATAALSFAEFAREHPAEFGFLSLSLSDPRHSLSEEEARYVHEATAAALAELAAPLAGASAEGTLEEGDAEERALTLWAALQGVLQTRKLSRNAPGRIDADRLARNLVRTLLVGWGADKNNVDTILELVDRRGLASLDGSTDWMLEQGDGTATALGG